MKYLGICTWQKYMNMSIYTYVNIIFDKSNSSKEKSIGGLRFRSILLVTSINSFLYSSINEIMQ